MENTVLSPKAMKAVLKSQRDEETGTLLYARIAKREKNPENKRILLKMSEDERRHADIWKAYSGMNVKAYGFKLWILNLVSIILGYTFLLKRVQNDEAGAVKFYSSMKDELPEAEAVASDEYAHEEALIAMLDEERLQYVGAMVLGLNDALVELTGAMAGLSFAFSGAADAGGYVAMSGIITGISATLSMAASNYLAERANDNPKALKSSIFTGIAYLVTVALLVFPYLIFRSSAFIPLVIMLCMVIVIIVLFNYYIAVAKSQSFFKRFAEMAAISISVAVVSFGIGLVAKALLGVEI